MSQESSNNQQIQQADPEAMELLFDYLHRGDFLKLEPKEGHVEKIIKFGNELTDDLAMTATSIRGNQDPEKTIAAFNQKYREFFPTNRRAEKQTGNPSNALTIPNGISERDLSALSSMVLGLRDSVELAQDAVQRYDRTHGYAVPGMKNFAADCELMGKSANYIGSNIHGAKEKAFPKQENVSYQLPTTPPPPTVQDGPGSMGWVPSAPAKGYNNDGQSR